MQLDTHANNSLDLAGIRIDNESISELAALIPVTATPAAIAAGVAAGAGLVGAAAGGAALGQAID